MNLNEILIHLGGPKEDWWSGRFNRHDVSSQLLGSHGNIQYYFEPDRGMLYAYNTVSKKAIVKAYIGKVKQKAWGVGTLASYGTYSGFDVPYEMYLAFISKGYSLVSGDVQTPGSQKLWKKLIGTSGVQVMYYPNISTFKNDPSEGQNAKNMDEDEIWELQDETEDPFNDSRTKSSMGVLVASE